MSTESDRVHEIRSPLPPDSDGQSPLLLRSMKVDEEISHPFRYQLDVLSKNGDIDPNDLLGESITVIVRTNQRVRYFNGLVSRFANLGQAGGYTLYHIELRPWFWFLQRTANCRIFQELSVTDIFSKVAKDTHGFSDFQLALSESYTSREYCVQYRETDLNFLSRLLEEEGIFYFFQHQEDKHVLVLGDSRSAFEAAETGLSGDQIPYRAPGEAQQEQEHVSQWQVNHELQSAKAVLDDFDFRKPKVDLEGQSQISRSHGLAEFEVYDYPGCYEEVADGERYAKIRIQELQGHHKLVTAEGDHRALCAGQTFNLIEYPRDSENAEYVVLATEIEIRSAEVEQFRADAVNRFDVRFTAYPCAIDPFYYRPPRRVAKPVVKGPQTAIVVGKSSEEIWTDKYGRVKVQFHWDREGQSDENSSCWIRVAQVWAGKNWGGIQIPRIGQEVVVDFLEGDPDRPLITGRVYNDDVMPPYALPDHQTQSGMISRSTKQGTRDTFNELRFEDLKDEEEIYFHAEKNFVRIVENNDALKVGFDKQDPGDQTIEVFNNQVVKIGNSSAGDGSQSIEVWKNRTADVKTGNDATTVSQGNHSVKVTAGHSTIEAAQKITLKVGGSTITIEPASIKISAPQITIEGQATTDVKGTMTTLEGSGMAMIKGGLVKIN